METPAARMVRGEDPIRRHVQRALRERMTDNRPHTKILTVPLDDLGLLGRGISHASSSPSPFMLRQRPPSRRRSHGEGPSLRRRLRRAPYRPLIGVCRPPGTPWTSRNTSRRRCPRGGKAPRCFPRRADLLARCGSSLRPSTAGGFDAECPSSLALPELYPARISVSSSLPAAAMNQKSSLRENPQFVSRALTANTEARNPECSTLRCAHSGHRHRYRDDREGRTR